MKTITESIHRRWRTGAAAALLTSTAVGAAVQVVVSSTTNPAFQSCPAGVCPVDVGDNVIKVSVTATDTVNSREYVIRALRSVACRSIRSEC